MNPSHLEPVTLEENYLRSPITNVNKTHCPQGHEYTYENTYRFSVKYWTKKGLVHSTGRSCIICKNINNKCYYNKHFKKVRIP